MVTALKGAIIAAGRGERLRAAAGGMPKPLVDVNGVPMLLWQAAALRRAGASPIVALVNSETAAGLSARKVAIPPWLTVAVRDTANSMESLLALGAHLDCERFMLATVDAIAAPGALASFAAEAIARVEAAATQRIDGALAITRWRGDERPLFAASSGGIITRLGGAETATVTAGFYMLPASIFNYRARARAEGLTAMRAFLSMLLEAGFRFAAIEVHGVVDVDEAADLDAARAMLAAGGGTQ